MTGQGDFDMTGSFVGRYEVDESGQNIGDAFGDFNVDDAFAFGATFSDDNIGAALGFGSVLGDANVDAASGDVNFGAVFGDANIGAALGSNSVLGDANVGATNIGATLGGDDNIGAALGFGGVLGDANVGSASGDVNVGAAFGDANIGAALGSGGVLGDTNVGGATNIGATLGSDDNIGDAFGFGGTLGDVNVGGPTKILGLSLTDASIGAILDNVNNGAALENAKKNEPPRVTPQQQSQELEKSFKECPYPNGEQELELGRRLNLEVNQIKYWFQNRRTTQTKMNEQGVINENAQMKKVIDADFRTSIEFPNNLHVTPQGLGSGGERLKMKEISVPMVRPSGPGRNAPQELGSGGQPSTSLVSPLAVKPFPSLTTSNAGTNAPQELGSGSQPSRMKERPMHPSAVQSTTSNVGRDAPQGLDSGGEILKPVETSMPLVSPHVAQLEFEGGETSGTNERSVPLVSTCVVQPSSVLMTSNVERNEPQGLDSSHETLVVNESTTFLLKCAKVALKELTMLAATENPFWIKDPSSKRETLNSKLYKSAFKNGIQRHGGYAIEASRETGEVDAACLALVQIFTEAREWMSVFASIVGWVNTCQLLPNGPSSAGNDSLKMIDAEFQVISPLVPIRKVKFIRYCTMFREGLWVVVDVSPPTNDVNLLSNGYSNRFPSGVVIEETKNGHSKVTWIEQTEYDENHIHPLYRFSLASGIAFGARRWLMTLQRHYECLSNFSSIDIAEAYQERVTSKTAIEMVKLSQRMTHKYNSSITSSLDHKWNVITGWNDDANMRMMVRKNVDDERGERTGIVMSLSTSVWFPVEHHKMFVILCHPFFRNQWDRLTGDGFKVETNISIRKAMSRYNIVSLLRINKEGNQILQENWCDKSGALVVYAPVDFDSVEKVMRGEEDSDSTKILPSGFSILPDVSSSGGEGCLLTLGFQFMVTAIDKPKQEAVYVAKEIVTITIDKIKTALDIKA